MGKIHAIMSDGTVVTNVEVISPTLCVTLLPSPFAHLTKPHRVYPHVGFQKAI